MSIEPNLIGGFQSLADHAWWGVAAVLGAGAAWIALTHQRRAASHPLIAENAHLRTHLVLREWELDVTRRFLGARNLSARLQILLDALVADPQQGFAAIFRLVGSETSRKLTIRTRLAHDTISLGSLSISESELTSIRGIEGLSTFERSRLAHLYCLRLGSIRHPWGLLISTELPAIQPGAAANLSGWEHLTSILGEELALQESLDKQGSELALTREMLELRSLADKQFRSPSHLLQEFLRRLAELTDFERATLVLNEEEQELCDVPQLRGGVPMARDLWAGWELAEGQLLAGASGASASAIWTEAELRRLGIGGPFAFAVLLPLYHHDWRMGQLCLTRRSSSPIHESHRKLIHWGAQFLVELVARTVDRAAIEMQAKRDGLTHLANRRTFDIELDRMLDRANRVGDELSLILLDLDHFKAVNDTHGHLGGDAALKAVARIVERSVQTMRDGDQPLVARYGGEEMAVLLPGVGEAGARRIAESIREAVRRSPIPFDGAEFHITLSAGVSMRSPEITTSRELISAADAALYRAKANGRNRVEVTETSEGQTEPLGRVSRSPSFR
jgi:diguanylate cyclase (GGDEF)-like protein